MQTEQIISLPNFWSLRNSGSKSRGQSQPKTDGGPFNNNFSDKHIEKQKEINDQQALTVEKMEKTSRTIMKLAVPALSTNSDDLADDQVVDGNNNETNNETAVAKTKPEPRSMIVQMKETCLT